MDAVISIKISGYAHVTFQFGNCFLNSISCYENVSPLQINCMQLIICLLSTLINSATVFYNVTWTNTACKFVIYFVEAFNG